MAAKVVAWCLSVLLASAAGEAAGHGAGTQGGGGSQDPASLEHQKLPPCQACSALVGSFESGMARTARGKLEGGDAAWEEKNQLKGYSTSEVRFVEIEEKLCQELTRGKTQCHANHAEWEGLLEEWWRQQSSEDDEKSGEDPSSPLKEWLCTDRLKVCCPQGHFGADCAPCQHLDQDTGAVCSGNGKCKGDGSRKGNGRCSCDPGYTGDSCGACSIGHYTSYQDGAKLLCSKCHKSCSDHCTGPGPRGCAACAVGYLMDVDHGCLDVDECVSGNEHKCNKDQFCANTEGSYKCTACDKACQGCFADGPDSCEACAEGYVFQKNQGGGGDDGGFDDKAFGSKGVCVSEEAAGRMVSLSNSRYVTYAGLCIATAIIAQRSIYIAGALGLVIAGYISLSEYYLQGATGELRPVSTGS